MKVIFLDIDGVLNYESFMLHPELHSGEHPVTSVEYAAEEIAPSCIRALKILVEQTDAKIIISSTWRHGRSIQTLGRILHEAGFDGEVIGKIDYQKDSREAKILRWIENSHTFFGLPEIESFVILDDEPSRFPVMQHLPSFISIDPKAGLVYRQAQCAAEVLNTSKGIFL